jgi:DNA-binding MarR family transcriptional regulator
MVGAYDACMTAPRSRAPDVAEAIGQLIARVRRRVWSAAADRLAEEMDESIFRWQLLNHVVRLGHATQRELAASTLQHPAGVSRTLEELESAGLVERTRDAADRRKVRVAVTRKGLARFRRMHPRVVRAVAGTLAPLTRAEQRTLRALLERLVEPPG